MKTINIIIITMSFLIPLCFSSFAFSNDLDDGISSYKDDSIRKWDNLGKKDRNINFIKMNAKSKALVRKKSGEQIQGSVGTGSGGTNMNSVVLGPGTNVRGDIIIIDESKGDKTLISE